MSFEEKNKKAEVRLDDNDHRELNKIHHYYHVDEKVGPGLPLWLPNGVVLRNELEKLMCELEFLGGYQRVVSPHIAKEELYYQSGHLPYYEEGMFPAMKLENSSYRLRPMCCPHHHKIFASAPRSYRDLPIRFAEYGQVYRYELSGVMSGLMRVRGLCQNDAHIYCRKDQVQDEIRQVLEMYQEAYRILGIEDFRLRLSKWDPSEQNKKYVAMAEQWEWAENILRQVLIDLGLPFEEEAGEAAFYGPKIDVQLKSIYGKEESASTVQLDIASAARFELAYVNEQGVLEEPVIIHRAPLGSHERLVAFVIEKYKGAFPVWLSPVQVKVLAIADRHHVRVKEIQRHLQKSFIRVEADLRVESLSKKMAEAQAQKVPYVVIIGDQEIASGQLSLKIRGQAGSPRHSVEELRREVLDKIERRGS